MLTKGLSKSITALGLACIFGANAAGCANLSRDNYFHDVHLSKDHMNRDLFEDLADFEQRLKRLENKRGLSEEDVFATLEIDRHRFSIVPNKEVMPWLTGGANLNPQTQEAIDYTIDMARRAKVYTAQFKEVDEHGALRFFLSSQTENEGFDMQMVLTFVDGKLFRANAAGNPHVNGKKIKYVWETLGDIAVGAILGGGAIGAAKMVK